MCTSLQWMRPVAAVINIINARRRTEVQGVDRATNFSQRIDPMLLQEIFQTPFSSNNNKKKRKTYRPVARQKHTCYANR